MSKDFETALSAILVANLSGFEELIACDKLTAGASQETYHLRTRVHGEERSYALRRSSLEDSSEGGAEGAINLTEEAQLLQVMVDSGIPVPEVYYVLRPQDNLGSGFLMQWLEGETLGSRIVRGDALAAARPTLAAQCGTALARIHNVDWRAQQLESVLTELSPKELVLDTWNSYKELGVSEPMIDYSARWLLDNAPNSYPTTIVHGDFRNGNLMIDSSGIVAVLDWEITHLGDPVRDLGWLCINSWRFGETQLPVGGFGKIEDLLNAYNAEAKTPVTEDQLLYWQVFGSFWWSVSCLTLAETWRSGENSSVERPAIGRRSSEAQMDCVNLLLPGDYDTPVAHTETDKQYQLPHIDELLESVEQFLQQDAAPQMDARGKYLSRVASKTLATARREFALGPELAAAEKARLQQLLQSDAGRLELRQQLVTALRENLPLDTEGLGTHLRQTVAGQLMIDQPGYGALH